MFKFLHAADLHLDSPLRGLDRYDGAPVEGIRRATRHAVENLVAAALEERAAFVVIAGDVYDGDWPDYNTGLFFARQMARLREAGIAVYLLTGNHDAASVITKSLALPDNVYVFPTDKPGRAVHEPTGTALFGQGFAKREVKHDLSANYPPPEPGCFNLGVLHTSAAGCEGHEPYAPCTVEGLCGRGYDYWALGHIHLRQTLCDAGPVVAYSGNTQGRHVRETGPKGCLVVTVDGGAATTAFRPLDVFRWDRRAVAADGCDTPDDVLERVSDALREAVREADGRPLAVRFEIAGRCDAHAQIARDAERWEHEVRSLAAQEAGETAWVERVRFATQPPADESDAILDGPLAELRRLALDVGRDEALLADLAAEIKVLKDKLPRDVRDYLLRDCPTAAGLDDPTWLRPLADDAGRLLTGRLLGDT